MFSLFPCWKKKTSQELPMQSKISFVCFSNISSLLKVVWVTAIAPYVVLLFLLIRSIQHNHYSHCYLLVSSISYQGGHFRGCGPGNQILFDAPVGQTL